MSYTDAGLRNPVRTRLSPLRTFVVSLLSIHSHPLQVIVPQFSPEELLLLSFSAQVLQVEVISGLRVPCGTELYSTRALSTMQSCIAVGLGMGM